jgi:hypothetical protein
MAFIVGAMVGNLFGMFLMGLVVASRDRNDADRVYREYRADGVRAATLIVPVVDKQSTNE